VSQRRRHWTNWDNEHLAQSSRLIAYSFDLLL
jgi:hypothetical protein